MVLPELLDGYVLIVPVELFMVPPFVEPLNAVPPNVDPDEDPPLTMLDPFNVVPIVDPPTVVPPTVEPVDDVPPTAVDPVIVAPVVELPVFVPVVPPEV